MVDEGDVLDSLELRRPDSDAPGNLYRYYEVPGAPHMDASYYRHMPVVEDQVKVGQQPFVSAWPLAYGCDINIPLQDHPLFRYAVSAALDNIDRWVREGVPAPKAERLAVRRAGEKSELVLDKFGNATGGIRSPYLDVPIATYHPKTPGPAVCANLLHTTGSIGRVCSRCMVRRSSTPRRWPKLWIGWSSNDGFGSQTGKRSRKKPLARPREGRIDHDPAAVKK